MKGRSIIVVYLTISMIVGIFIIPTIESTNPIGITQHANPTVVYVNNKWKDQADVNIYNMEHDLNLEWNYDATNDIQNGINLVGEGGDVRICTGTGCYCTGISTIDITKSLNLIGENKTTTIIDGSGWSSVIGVRAPSVSINNLTIRNGKQEYKYAGIVIYQTASDVEVFNCILKNNGHGIYTDVKSDIKDLTLKIYQNEITLNTFDGLLIRSRCRLFNNSIVRNDNDGIEINTESSSLIYDNVIENNNGDGIWVDALTESEDHIIFNNTLAFNKGGGIHFGDWWNRGDCVEYCEVYDNVIINNSLGGIILHRSRHNKIYDNLIMNNSKFGCKIIYYFYQEKLWTERKKFPIMGEPFSESNKIFHNNFITNGRKGKVNAIDSRPNSNNDWTSNYYSDDNHIDNDQDGEDDDNYALRRQVFGIVLPPFLSCCSDDSPMCRINCWNPTKPDVPSLIPPESMITYTGTKLTFGAITSDINEDLIGYNWSWGDGSFTTDTNDNKYYFCKQKSECKHSWSEPGFYEVSVKAFDVYKVNMTDEKGESKTEYKICVDGESDWSQSIVIEIKEKTY